MWAVIYLRHEERIRSLSVSSSRLLCEGLHKFNTSASPSVITLPVKACRCASCVWYSVGGIFTVQYLNSWIKCTDSCPLRYVTIQSPLSVSAVLSRPAVEGTSALTVSGLLAMRPALNAKLTRLLRAPLLLQESETHVRRSLVISTRGAVFPRLH